jgi:hypothetical protein
MTCRSHLPCVDDPVTVKVLIGLFARRVTIFCCDHTEQVLFYRCDTVWSSRSLPTFRRDLLPSVFRVEDIAGEKSLSPVM